MNIKLNDPKSILIILALVALLYQCATHKPEPKDSKPLSSVGADTAPVVAKPYPDNTAMIVAAHRQIKDYLKDPDSVKFAYERTKETSKYGEVACGAFNAKNSFGAYAGNVRYISNGKTLFIEGNDDTAIPFPEMWNEVCL